MLYLDSISPNLNREWKEDDFLAISILLNFWRRERLKMLIRLVEFSRSMRNFWGKNAANRPKASTIRYQRRAFFVVKIHATVLTRTVSKNNDIVIRNIFTSISVIGQRQNTTTDSVARPLPDAVLSTHQRYHQGCDSFRIQSKVIVRSHWRIKMKRSKDTNGKTIVYLQSFSLKFSRLIVSQSSPNLFDSYTQ